MPTPDRCVVLPFPCDDDSAPPIRPREAVRQRLLAALDRNRRFDGLVDRLARCLTVDTESVRALLRSVDSGEEWTATQIPGHEVLDLPSSSDGALHLLVRVLPGYRVPPHEHSFDELAFCLEGQADQLDGERLEAGDFRVFPAGERHGCLSSGQEPCLLLLRRL